MFRIPRKLKSFDGVGWGNIARARLAGGPMYHEIVFNTNALEDDIVSVTLTVNGDVKYKLPGWALKMLERFKKKWEETGRYVIALADISLYSLEGQIISALNTAPTDNILLEVEFGDGTASVVDPNATPATLEAEAEVSNSDPTSAVALYVPRTRLVNLKGGGSGEVTIDNLHQKSNGNELLRRAHFDGRDGGANDYITNLEVLVDNTKRWEQSKGNMRFNLKRHDKAPQAGFYHFDPIRSGFPITEMFNMAHSTSLEFKPTISNAMSTIPVIIETLERVVVNG